MISILSSLVSSLEMILTDEEQITAFFEGIIRIIGTSSDYIANIYILLCDIIAKQEIFILHHCECIVQVSLEMLRNEELSNYYRNILSFFYFIYDMSTEESLELKTAITEQIIPILLDLIQKTFDKYDENEFSVEFFVVSILSEIIDLNDDIIGAVLIPFCESSQNPKAILYIMLALANNELLTNDHQEIVVQSLVSDDSDLVLLAIKILTNQNNFIDKETIPTVFQTLLDLISNAESYSLKEDVLQAFSSLLQTVKTCESLVDDERNELFYNIITTILSSISQEIPLEVFSNFLECLTQIIEVSEVYEFASIFCTNNDSSDPLFIQFISFLDEIDKDNLVFRSLISFITQIFQTLRTDFAPFVETVFQYFMSFLGTNNSQFAIYSIGCLCLFTKCCSEEQIAQVIEMIIRILTEHQNEQEIYSALSCGSFLSQIIDYSPFIDAIFPLCCNLLNDSETWGDIKGNILEFMHLLTTNSEHNENILEMRNTTLEYAFQTARELQNIYECDDEIAQQIATITCNIFSSEFSHRTQNEEKEAIKEKSFFLLGKIATFSSISSKLGFAITQLLNVLSPTLQKEQILSLLTDESMSSILSGIKKSEEGFHLLKRVLLQFNSSPTEN